MAKDHYWVLGIERDASHAQIEFAYRMRMQNLESQPSQGAPLLDVQEAYSVLGDPHRRRAYDLPHKTPIQSGVAFGPEPLIPQQTPGDVIDVSVRRSFRTASPSFDEIDDRLWGNFQQVTRPKAETIESLTLELPITPQQAINGGQARVLVPARAQCPACGGQGSVGLFACRRCDGSGALLVEYPLIVEYPPGISDYAVQLPLDRFGIHNFFLTVFFRVTRGLIE